MFSEREESKDWIEELKAWHLRLARKKNFLCLGVMANRYKNSKVPTLREYPVQSISEKKKTLI